MTTPPQVSTTVLHLLADSAGCEIDDITTDTLLRGDVIDSLDAIIAVIDIEDELGIAIQDSDLGALRTVGDLLTLCERLAGARRLS